MFDFHFRNRREIIKAVLATALAILVMGVILFPVYYMFTVSLKPQGTLASTSLDIIPDHTTLQNYKEVLFGHKDATIKTKTFNITSSKGKVIGTGYTIEYTDGVIYGKARINTLFNLKYVSHVKVEGANKTVEQNQEKYIKGKFVSIDAEKIAASQGILGDVYLKAKEVRITVTGNPSLKLEGLTKVGNNTYVGQNVILKLPSRARIDSEKGHFEAEDFYYVFINKIGGGFFGYLKRSLIIATLTVVLTLLFTIPAAYAFSRLKFFGREHILYFYLMFTQVSGGLGIAGLIALYGMLVKLNLTNNIYVLPFIYAAGGVPFNTWLLKSYLDSISPDFDEAALVDGANYLQIIRYVLLPMALPGIATVAIFAFINGWTELIIANLLLNQENYPLTVWLYSMLNDLRNVSWNQFSAAALLFALPVFIMFLLAQNYIKSGLTVGGLKE
ncbi:malg sugar transport inner membrane protein [Thermococcus guaymasensis DSM 11113]|uniref:Malg sugar transport inner membrane protein n=1 Tax=Thermococcus guaymasensis DSM 11113 TaxID=1432656 RepID=A0A0X1KL26_9EURY|nr:sugar ABC transporter permease [Thermococcus guaymasensis]AJC71969.1 malg sugar transport inner membrane protein [Thermococcus guaymasensis DSM 11113]